MLPFDSFERVSDSSPAAITLCTPQHEIVWANAAHEELFGHHPADVAGWNCTDLVHPDHRQALRRASEDVLAEPSLRVSWDSRVVCRLGRSRWVQNIVCALPGVGYILYQLDIYGRRSANSEHEQRAKEFAAANARLEEFAYSAAHDLRAPLRAIGTCTELMARDANMSSGSREMATFVASGVTRMSALIDDMLSFATSHVQPQIVIVDLEAAVSQAAQNLAPEMANSAASLVVGALPAVPGSDIQFGRIFQNLIGNAIKYRRTQPLTIEITAELTGTEWVVAVRDNGIGIGVEHHGDIFLPFKRLGNSKAPGSGLGLTLTKNIIERLGGAIWVESELGSGSTFLFSIPAVSSEVAKKEIHVSEGAVRP